MNKTIIININGIIFHIEEDAYEILQNYMTAVKRHFGYSPDSNEIVSDIENRIAEMFSERINQQKAVITMQDVNKVTAQMGHISDFEDFDGINEEDAMGNAGAEYQKQNYSDSRGLYRDPDDKVIGGVCSGLGHYFDIEAKWVRLALILLFLFAGTGLLLYIILWILMPLARTRADKMSMRGEAANLHNFKRNFDEEMEDIKRNFTVAGQKISPGLKNTARKTGDVLDKLIRIIVKIIGIFVIIIASVSIISLVIALCMAVGSSNSGFIEETFRPAHFIDPAFFTPFIWVCFLAIVIPLITIVLLSMKMISSLKISKYLGYTLLIIWITSIGFVIYYASVISMDHAVESSVSEITSLTPEKTYYLTANDVRSISKSTDSVYSNGLKSSNKIVIKRGRSFLEIRPRIYINKLVQGEMPTVSKEFSAEGRNFDIATERAQHIGYKITQNNETLIFDSHATIGKNDLNRDQGVRVELNIPVGTKVIIDNEIRYRIYNVSFDPFEEEYDDQPTPQQSEWLMTENGLEYIPRSQREFLPGSQDTLNRQKDSISIQADTVLQK